MHSTEEAVVEEAMCTHKVAVKAMEEAVKANVEEAMSIHKVAVNLTEEAVKVVAEEAMCTNKVAVKAMEEAMCTYKAVVKVEMETEVEGVRCKAAVVVAQCKEVEEAGNWEAAAERRLVEEEETCSSKLEVAVSSEVEAGN